MKTIHKYKLEIKDRQRLELPKNARVLTIQMQNKDLCLWAIVDTSNEYTPRYFHIVGTGNEVPENVKYITTVQDERFDLASYVWHIFEEFES